MSARHRPRPVPSALVRAAGAIVWRLRATYAGAAPRIGQVIDPEDLEVLIVHRPRYNDWSWPKGKAENGELLAAAAVREVEEETGEVIRLGAPLTIQRYRLGSGHTKEVHYWVGRQAGGTAASRIRPPVVRAPHKEIDDCRWVSPEEAHKMLTRRGDRRLLTEVTSLATSGVLVTEPMLIMRAAQTVELDRWEGVLAERHLTRKGVRQSLDVIDTLSAFGVQGIHSSEWVSAYRSVAPYASVVGLPIQTHSELIESAAVARPDGATRFLMQMIEKMQAPTLVAVHRATLPLMVETLRRHADVDVRAALPTDEPLLRPAELLVAHVGAPRCSELSATVESVDAQLGLSPRDAGADTSHLVSAPQPARPRPRPIPHPGLHRVVSQVVPADSVTESSERVDIDPCPEEPKAVPRHIIAVERHAIPGSSVGLMATVPSV